MKIIKKDTILLDLIEEDVKNYLIENGIIDLYLRELEKLIKKRYLYGFRKISIPFNIMDIDWSLGENGPTFWSEHYGKTKKKYSNRNQIEISKIIKIQ